MPLATRRKRLRLNDERRVSKASVKALNECLPGLKIIQRVGGGVNVDDVVVVDKNEGEG